MVVFGSDGRTPVDPVENAEGRLQINDGQMRWKISQSLDLLFPKEFLLDSCTEGSSTLLD